MTLHEAVERAREDEAVERSHLRGEVSKLKTLLRHLEWAGYNDRKESRECPACGGIEDVGHREECGLKEAIDG